MKNEIIRQYLHTIVSHEIDKFLDPFYKDDGEKNPSQAIVFSRVSISLFRSI